MLFHPCKSCRDYRIAPLAHDSFRHTSISICNNSTNGRKEAVQVGVHRYSNKWTSVAVHMLGDRAKPVCRWRANEARLSLLLRVPALYHSSLVLDPSPSVACPSRRHPFALFVLAHLVKMMHEVPKAESRRLANDTGAEVSIACARRGAGSI